MNRGRTIIVGDVHGCRDETERLLDRVHYAAGDALYFTGDLLSRGPDPVGTLALLRQTHARSVLGNHDDALVQWHAAQARGETPKKRKASLERIAEQLGDDDWAFLDSLPLYLELPDHQALLVHAGVVPGIPIERQSREALLTMRYLGPNGEPIEKGGTVLWGTRYAGPPHVVFGHNAQPEPQLHAWATGIDTAAVYGGNLTAMVLGEGEPIPAAERRRNALVSVGAKERYYVPLRRM